MALTMNDIYEILNDWMPKVEKILRDYADRLDG